MENLIFNTKKKRVVHLNNKIRHLVLNRKDSIDLSRVSISEIKEGSINGESIRRVIIILRSMGCKWSLDLQHLA